ncbi:MAG: hypothetical protein JNM79_11550 [Burkholderiales bacterium]|nr:hypothetical protein [Burkholderiales bacterium]
MPKPHVVNVQFNNEHVFWGDYASHFLAEGDSWFGWAHLNLVPSSNLLEQLPLRRSAVVISYAYSGDTMRNMGELCCNSAFAQEIGAQNYEAILLSGGGNDLIDALPHVLRAADPAAPPTRAVDCVDAAALDLLFDSYVLPNYRQIIGYRASGSAANQSTPVLIHTYDVPTARDAPATFLGIPAVGPWLLPALVAARIPEALHQEVVALIFARMESKLLTLDDPAAHVHVVKTSGTIARALPDQQGLSGDWINEIHPDAHGYALIAAKLAKRLAEINVD